MKTLSEESGLRILEEFRESFRSAIEKGYEHSAKDCVTCDVQGECCTDAHFVNVRISRLDAVAIEKEIESLDKNLRARVLKRVSVTRIAESGTYSCPLFEKGVGCLVHENAKPLPCINHACYERPEDLPPSSLTSAG